LPWQQTPGKIEVAHALRGCPDLTTVLDKYLTDPKAMVPGSPMALALPDVADRANVIAYMKTFSQ
jgi:cytochrome c2